MPAEKLCDHGLAGRTGPRFPAAFCGASNRSSGSSSLAGVPGGSISYGTSENITRPSEPFEAMRRRTVARIVW